MLRKNKLQRRTVFALDHRRWPCTGRNFAASSARTDRAASSRILYSFFIKVASHVEETSGFKKKLSDNKNNRVLYAATLRHAPGPHKHSCAIFTQNFRFIPGIVR